MPQILANRAKSSKKEEGKKKRQLSWKTSDFKKFVFRQQILDAKSTEIHS